MSTYGIEPPLLLTADAYTVGSGLHVSEDAKDFSGYQIIARKRPEWMDTEFKEAEWLVGKLQSRFVQYGLGFPIYDLLSKPLTHDKIDESLEFLTTYHAGGKVFRIDEKVWRRVVDECKGIPPILIRGLRDGETFFLGEPICQVSSLKKGFGELAGYFESKLLQAWMPIEHASMMRHWLDYNKALVKHCTSSYMDEDQLNFMAGLQTHGFGDRASSTPQESERLELAYLASGHFGTDTTCAAYIAWILNNKKPIASTIHALAHRIVQGFKKEGDAYSRLFEMAQKDYSSHVMDCYDYFRAIDKYAVPLAKLAKEKGGVIVARPDSGDPLEQLLYTFNAAVDATLSEIVHKGLNLRGMTHLKSIEGDGMTFGSIIGINNSLLKEGFAPPYCGIYGIGGSKRNLLARDNLGLTMKLCAVGESQRPVMKFSHTPGKGSVPGLVKICREAGKPTVRHMDEPGEDINITWFDGSLELPFERPTETFDSIRNRIMKDFHKFPLPTDVYSAQIKEMKKTLHHEFVD